MKTKVTREEMIELLVGSDIDCIEQGSHIDDTEYISNILTDGFKGYAKFTEEELLREYQDRTGD